MRRGGARLYALGLLACTAIALWLVWPALAPGRIVNLDAPRHLLRTVVMTRQFLPSGHVDGWSPFWYLGAQLFLFQSYGYFFLIGASALMLGRFVALEHVFKFFYVLPVLALPAVTALMARRLGVARRGALAAALASLIFSSPLGYGVQGMFGIGLLLQGAGVIGFALAWPEILRVLLDRDRAPWRAVLVVAAVLICHFITGAYTLAAAGCVAAGLAVATRDVRPLLRYSVLAALVLAIAAHTLFPSLELRDLSGAAVGWGSDRERFDRIMQGTLFGAQALALPALAAAAWSIFRGGKALSISAMVFFVTALLGGANEQPWEPLGLQQLLQVMVRPRALPYAVLFQAVFAGVAVDLFLRATETAATSIGRASWAKVATPAAFAAVLLIGIPEWKDQRRFVRTESALKDSDRRVYLALVKWLRAHVERPAIVAVPRLLLPSSAVGARSVISLLNLDTGLYTLGGDQAELSQSSRRARVDLDHLDEHAARNAGVLRAAGVSHLIVSAPELRSRLAGNPNYDLVFEYEQPSRRSERKTRGNTSKKATGVAVYRLRGGGVWLHGPGVEVRDMKHSPERLWWNLAPQTTPRETRVATAAVNWHPNWVASVDGVRVPTRTSPARRVSFEVPAGAGRVMLEFVRPTREKLWNALSAATFLMVVAAWWRDRRARRVQSSDPQQTSTRTRT